MFTFYEALEILKSTRESDKFFNKVAIERIIWGAHGHDSPSFYKTLFEFYSSIEDWTDFNTMDDCSNAFYNSLTE